SMLSAALILAIMVIPFISSISREVLKSVPAAQREGAYALGATRFEAIRAALFYARTGIVGAVMLGFGRALGETMAVTMVIGNNPKVSVSLFAPQYTMAAVIANEFAERELLHTHAHAGRRDWRRHGQLHRRHLDPERSGGPDGGPGRRHQRRLHVGVRRHPVCRPCAVCGRHAQRRAVDRDRLVRLR